VALVGLPQVRHRPHLGNEVTTLLIDGDIFIYQIASKAETPVDWGDGQWTLSADFDIAKQELDDYLAKLQSTLDAHDTVVAIKDSQNWRRTVLSTYKAHRDNVREPMLRKPLMQHVRDTYRVFSRPTLEGDDVLGILATSEKIIKGRKIVVSIDKDMKQIPGEHYNPKTEEHFTVLPANADYWHMVQTLTGDATDGYKGCPGVGPKSAERILVQTGGGVADNWVRDWYWPRIIEAYEAKGLTEADALVQARVARICRNTDYDFTKKEVILWNPPPRS
jgi:DNA polymerase-1